MSRERHVRANEHARRVGSAHEGVLLQQTVAQPRDAVGNGNAKWNGIQVLRGKNYEPGYGGAPWSGTPRAALRLPDLRPAERTRSSGWEHKAVCCQPLTPRCFSRCALSTALSGERYLGPASNRRASQRGSNGATRAQRLRALRAWAHIHLSKLLDATETEMLGPLAGSEGRNAPAASRGAALNGALLPFRSHENRYNGAHTGHHRVQQHVSAGAHFSESERDTASKLDVS